MLHKLLFSAFLIMAAIGMGLYVYPTSPTLVWGLLFVCWACFRLTLRAQAIFGRQHRSHGD